MADGRTKVPKCKEDNSAWGREAGRVGEQEDLFEEQKCSLREKSSVKGPSSRARQSQTGHARKKNAD